MSDHERRYRLLIAWSDDDVACIATIPELNIRTHGATYEEAFRLGHELMDEVLATCEQLDTPLPAPRLHPVYPASA